MNQLPITSIGTSSGPTVVEPLNDDPFAQVNLVLTTFRFSRLRFDLQLQEVLELPHYYGSMLRGGLGFHFKHLVCVQPQVKTCRDCVLLHQCAYPAVFETPLPPALPNAPHLQEVSPYVLAPLTPAGRWNAGDSMSFHLLLFGNAINYLPYFVISYRQLGLQAGLGRNRAHFTLARVVDETPGFIPCTLYDQTSGSVNMLPQRTTLHRCLPTLPTTIERLYLDFLTPTRLKAQSKITNHPDFSEIWAALMRRLSQLALVHREKEVPFSDGAAALGAWAQSEQTLIARATTITTVNAKLQVEKWERFSSRQAQSIRMGGVVGELTLEGALQPFLPVLWAGQYLHIGRGTAFGNGRYQLRL